MSNYNESVSRSSILQPYYARGVACWGGACAVYFVAMAAMMVIVPEMMDSEVPQGADPVGHPRELNTGTLGGVMVISMLIQAICFAGGLAALVFFVLDLIQFGHARAELTEAMITGEIGQADGEDRSPYLQRGIIAVIGSIVAVLIAYGAMFLTLPTITEISNAATGSLDDLVGRFIGRIILVQFIVAAAGFAGALGLVSIVRGVIQRHFEMKLARKV